MDRLRLRLLSSRLETIIQSFRSGLL
ncbi:hypothetical protein [Roseibium sp. MMSF_3361]